MARGYETNVEVWGPGVLHPKHPCIEIIQGDVTIVIADPYQFLLEIVDKVHGMVVERKERSEEEARRNEETKS